MKIYNKKSFAGGAFTVALGTLNLIIDLINHTFGIKGISFLLMLALLVMGKISGYDGFISMGVGMAFAFSISMFTEIFTFMYYKHKN